MKTYTLEEFADKLQVYTRYVLHVTENFFGQSYDCEGSLIFSDDDVEKFNRLRIHVQRGYTLRQSAELVLKEFKHKQDARELLQLIRLESPIPTDTYDMILEFITSNESLTNQERQLILSFYGKNSTIIECALDAQVWNEREALKVLDSALLKIAKKIMYLLMISKQST